ncbi:ATP-binding cassette domain-containing protein [Microbacter sp. GSS18]|nr:ATP-binding cassette domain-containing protein [Microbacter sp. GSS18]
MTASLPMPHEADPDEPGGRPSRPRVVRLPAHPGPPPPLPPDLALPDVDVPPRPPLPATDRGATADEAPADTVLAPSDAPAPVEPESEDASNADDVADEVEDEIDTEVDAPDEVIDDVATTADTAEDVATAPEDVDDVTTTADDVTTTADDVGTTDAPVHDDIAEEEEEEAVETDGAAAIAAVEDEADSSAPVEEGPAAVELPEGFTPVVPDDAKTVLELRAVTKTFGGVRAVEAIDLSVPAGTFYGLVGPNGAGKTTTLSMIAGLLRPDSGTISVAGVDAGERPRAAKSLMGVLPDRLRTFDRLTGRQLLFYYGALRGMKPAIIESRTADLARAFDLSDALGRVVSDYSAGMLKKVMLAGAMIHAPRLLVLDEPFEAVDPVSSAVILEILSAYVAHGGTVILSSHGMDLVERVCSRVAVIVAGQVLAEGTVDEVRGELTLEQRFVELAGGLSDVEGLEWLHTFSD